MSHRSQICRALVGALAAVTGVVALCLPAQAEPERTDRQKVLVLKIEALASEGRCVEALPEIERARVASPADAGLALLEGQCRISTFDYAGAARALQQAKQLDPDQIDVDAYLAIARYHSEDFVGAVRSIDAAAGHVSREATPQYELYSGLLLLYQSKEREAALALERARMADASQVEPVASYYAGLAWRSVSERDQAREAFVRVIEVDGDGPWGQRARAAMGGEAMQDRTWIRARLGLEYDSNVVLLGDDIPLPTDISGQGDGRAVWFLDGGAELFRADRWAGGVLASYSGSANFQLNQFDTHYPTATLWIERSVAEQNLLRLRYSAGHAWVDYENFATTQAAILSFYRGWGRAGNSELSAGWDWNDYHYRIAFVPQDRSGTGFGSTCVPPQPIYFCSPPYVNTQVDQNRDGNGMRLGLMHRLPLHGLENDVLRELSVRGGYSFRRYWAEGTDWDRSGHELELGFATLLPFALSLDALAGFNYQPFDHPSSYPRPPVVINRQYALTPSDRLDQTWRVATEIERPITRWISVSTRYSYTRNDSNVDVFDYSRHVIGAYATLRF